MVCRLVLLTALWRVAVLVKSTWNGMHDPTHDRIQQPHTHLYTHAVCASPFLSIVLSRVFVFACAIGGGDGLDLFVPLRFSGRQDRSTKKQPHQHNTYNNIHRNMCMTHASLPPSCVVCCPLVVWLVWSVRVTRLCAHLLSGLVMLMRTPKRVAFESYHPSSLAAMSTASTTGAAVATDVRIASTFAKLHPREFQRKFSALNVRSEEEGERKTENIQRTCVGWTEDDVGYTAACGISLCFFFCSFRVRPDGRSLHTARATIVAPGNNNTTVGCNTLRAICEGTSFSFSPTIRVHFLSRAYLCVFPDSIPSCPGSSLVKIGQTSVVCGIKLEVGRPFDTKPQDGRLGQRGREGEKGGEWADADIGRELCMTCADSFVCLFPLHATTHPPLATLTPFQLSRFTWVQCALQSSRLAVRPNKPSR